MLLLGGGEVGLSFFVRGGGAAGGRGRAEGGAFFALHARALGSQADARDRLSSRRSATTRREGRRSPRAGGAGEARAFEGGQGGGAVNSARRRDSPHKSGRQRRPTAAMVVRALREGGRSTKEVCALLSVWLFVARARFVGSTKKDDAWGGGGKGSEAARPCLFRRSPPMRGAPGGADGPMAGEQERDRAPAAPLSLFTSHRHHALASSHSENARAHARVVRNRTRATALFAAAPPNTRPSLSPSPSLARAPASLPAPARRNTREYRHRPAPLIDTAMPRDRRGVLCWARSSKGSSAEPSLPQRPLCLSLARALPSPQPRPGAQCRFVWVRAGSSSSAPLARRGGGGGGGN